MRKAKKTPPPENEDDANLARACHWLEGLVAGYLSVHFGESPAFKPAPLEFGSAGSLLERLIQSHNPTLEEFALLMLAIAPHVRPGFYDAIIAAHLPGKGELPEFGGVKGANHRGILPTGQTAQFILAGYDPARGLAVLRLLSSDHWLARSGLLRVESVPDGEPTLSGRLRVDPEFVELLTTGAVAKPRFSSAFPAEQIATEMTWDDLVLHPHTLRQIGDLENWIDHHHTLLHEWGMKRKIKSGYRALFYGPPGTGKTLTATLLGKQTGRDVFRIDLSRVISKYIGETEKNLSSLFSKAENKDWILFFDEADALFGKRTDIRDAHDKYANQEVAYLLQRIEGYDGLVILASNQRGNLDEAFLRRFQAIVHFPMPRPEERHRIWSQAFPPQIKIGTDIDWRQVAARFELPGAGIMNVMQYLALQALADRSLFIDLKRLEAAILREYVKEGKVV